MNGFAIIEEKSSFLQKLYNGEIPEDWIVFVKDTQEIWTHGVFFGPNKHLVLTNEEYNRLSENNELDDDVFYYISE
jgi:hypothetical protein